MDGLAKSRHEFIHHLVNVRPDEPMLRHHLLRVSLRHEDAPGRFMVTCPAYWDSLILPFLT
jgi:hypothetical protein